MHLLKDENGNVIPHGNGPAHRHEHDHGCEEQCMRTDAVAVLTNVRTNL